MLEGNVVRCPATCCCFRRGPISKPSAGRQCLVQSCTLADKLQSEYNLKLSALLSCIARSEAVRHRSCVPQVPVTFIYGDGDWMEPAAGQRVARAVLQHRGRLSPTDGQVCSALLYLHSDAHALTHLHFPQAAQAAYSSWWEKVLFVHRVDQETEW